MNTETDPTPEPSDPDAAPSPEQSAALIQRQRRRAAARLEPDPLLLYLPWGVSWVLGFAAFGLLHGTGPITPVPWMTPLLAGLVLGVGIAAAIVVTATVGIRSGRDVAGRSQQRGAAFGAAWFLAFALVMTVTSRVSGELPGADAAMLYSGLSMAVTATLYIAGYAVFEDRNLLVLGVIIAVATLVAAALGTEWFFGVAAVFGGGAFLVAGFVLRPAWSRDRR